VEPAFSPFSGYPRDGSMNLQGNLKIEEADSFEMLIILASLHGFIIQKTIAVKTSNLIYLISPFNLFGAFTYTLPQIHCLSIRPPISGNIFAVLQ
jgi:hypothetical protein